MLTKKQLKMLRGDIVLNSLFIKDYSNNLFIKKENVCAFFDGYMEYLYELAHDDNYNSDDVNDVIKEYDNINNLYNYYLMFEYDPLLQNDVIASKPINNSDAVVIYDVNDNSVLSSIIYLDGLSYKNKPIVKNRIHYDNFGDTYINKYGVRYYLDDFMRV